MRGTHTAPNDNVPCQQLSTATQAVAKEARRSATKKCQCDSKCQPLTETRLSNEGAVARGAQRTATQTDQQASDSKEHRRALAAQQGTAETCRQHISKCMKYVRYWGEEEVVSCTGHDAQSAALSPYALARHV
jgi:hypothetical protein